MDNENQNTLTETPSELLSQMREGSTASTEPDIEVEEPDNVQPVSNKRKWVIGGIAAAVCASITWGGYFAYNNGFTFEKLASSISVMNTNYQVTGNSMNPTYTDGQILHFANGATTSVAKNEIVVATIPQDWQYGTDAHGVMIKRVVATEGDTVSVIAGALYVNGEQKTDINTTCKTESNYSYTLAAGEVFLMGDNHENSLDSWSTMCMVEAPESASYIVPVSSVKAHDKSPQVVQS